MPSQNERIFAALIFGVSFFTAFIGPVIIWLLKKNDSAFVDYYGKEYLNFLITYILFYIIGGISIIILVGFLILPLIGIAQLIFTIVATVKAIEGDYYRIPFIFRIL